MSIICGLQILVPGRFWQLLTAGNRRSARSSKITSDAGVLLLRERANQIGLFGRMAACFTDHRDPKRVKHHLPTLLCQRVCGMALGYEDVNDHDTLRNDPALKLLASSCLVSRDKTPAALAGKSTLNRLEHSREAGNPRYHQMVPNLKKLSSLFTDIFLDSHDTPPEKITLDIDATDIKAHGHQENSFFHGYGACPREGGGGEMLSAALHILRTSSIAGTTPPRQH